MKKNETPDATELLRQDHETVKELFAEFETASENEDNDEKAEIIEEITAALEAHAAIEEEIFYPAVKKARSENTKDEVREAYEEHQQIKNLLAALGELNPDDESYNAKVKVLREDVEHHVTEEEGEMFPDARKFIGKEKLQALGEKIAAMKAELVPEDTEAEELDEKAGSKQKKGKAR
ncbi:MAG TPA: hemerythrin domain-containing protein [Candidatus Binataceae bacterium]|jgi:hemerythrin superfamily protein|nr:hemerythrin domain-containing protein [Candidatus Binataceae bacterium]